MLMLLHQKFISMVVQYDASSNRKNRPYLPGLLLTCLLAGGCASGPAPQTAAFGSPPASASTTSSGPAQRARLWWGFKRYYRNWAGVPYRYGGTTQAGIDCSAFVKQATATVRGLWLPRTTQAQVKRGHRIPKSALTTGDLVFFKTGGGSRHVGIYIGNGRFMHASSSEGVTISRLDNIYWRRHFWQARRLPAPVQRR